MQPEPVGILLRPAVNPEASINNSDMLKKLRCSAVIGGFLLPSVNAAPTPAWHPENGGRIQLPHLQRPLLLLQELHQAVLVAALHAILHLQELAEHLQGQGWVSSGTGVSQTSHGMTNGNKPSGL